MYMNVDRDSIPKGSWRTPSLRDVALTAPYMHDGAYRDARGRSSSTTTTAPAPMANGTPDARIQPLFLTTEEESQLVAFLKTLTGEPLPAELSSPADAALIDHAATVVTARALRDSRRGAAIRGRRRCATGRR